MKNFISFSLVFLISYFISVSYCLADEIGSEINNNLSNESKSMDVKKDINDKVDISKASYEDLFGDEQAFPFVAGLGKNAAH